jgi:DNA-binding protein YbaB
MDTHNEKLNIVVRNRFKVSGQKANTQIIGKVEIDSSFYDYDELETLTDAILAFFPDGADLEISFTKTNSFQDFDKKG